MLKIRPSNTLLITCNILVKFLATCNTLVKLLPTCNMLVKLLTTCPSPFLSHTHEVHTLIHDFTILFHLPLERPRWRCANNIKMDLGEIGWGDMDWICLESSFEFGHQLSGSIKCWETVEWLHNW
jgi:hypothetical protein